MPREVRDLSPNPEERLLLEESASEAAPKTYQSEKRLLRRALAELSEREAAMVFLRQKGVSQTRIASMLGVSQPSVSNGLRRAEKRLRWLVRWGLRFTAEDLENALRGQLRSDQVKVLAVVWQTTSLGQTTAKLHLSRMTTRARFEQGLKRLAVLSRQRPWLRKYLAGLETVRPGREGHQARLCRRGGGPKGRQVAMCCSSGASDRAT